MIALLCSDEEHEYFKSLKDRIKMSAKMSAHLWIKLRVYIFFKKGQLYFPSMKHGIVVIKKSINRDRDLQLK